MSELNQQVTSLIRTFVPVLVGQIMGWAAVAGILDQNGQISGILISLLTMGFTALYYIVVRWFETYVSPKFGWLLGMAKQPDYGGKK